MDPRGEVSAVLEALGAESDPVRASHSYRYFKCGPGEYGEGDRFLGVTVPKQRRIARRFRSITLEAAAELLDSPFHEARLTALIVLTLRMESRKSDGRTRARVVALYLRKRRRVDNWDLVDTSAPKILGPWLEDRNRRLLDLLAASDSLWDNRIAMLTTLHFVRHGDLQDALRIAATLASHDHDLIHKAVGWLLREVGDQDRAILEAFLRRHRLPRTALRYALEHFPAAERSVWMGALDARGSGGT